jgi:hypothetical protein
MNFQSYGTGICMRATGSTCVMHEHAWEMWAFAVNLQQCLKYACWHQTTCDATGNASRPLETQMQCRNCPYIMCKQPTVNLAAHHNQTIQRHFMVSVSFRVAHIVAEAALAATAC